MSHENHELECWGNLGPELVNAELVLIYLYLFILHNSQYANIYVNMKSLQYII